jgi:hypothetical protein
MVEPLDTGGAHRDASPRRPCALAVAAARAAAAGGAVRVDRRRRRGAQAPAAGAAAAGVLTLAFAGLVLGAFRFAIGRDTGVCGLLAMLSLKPMEVFTRRDARSLLGFGCSARSPPSCRTRACHRAAGRARRARRADGVGRTGARRRTAPLRRQLRQAGFAALVAMPLALAGFWLFPRLGTPLWGLPDNARRRWAWATA